jgi:hypothetical protein
MQNGSGIHGAYYYSASYFHVGKDGREKKLAAIRHYRHSCCEVKAKG